MDPMTMMAIANFGMQMLNKGGQGGQGGGQQQAPQMQQPQAQQKPFQPGAIPNNPTDYGSIIKNMMAQQQPMPGQIGGMMPAMAQ